MIQCRMNESKKIMITGGHASPAIAVIDRLKALYPQHSIVFVGRKFNNGQESSESFEYQEIQKRKITFINLKAGRITRLLSLRTYVHILLVPLGFLQAVRILLHEQPDIILTFGGYLGLPIAVVGYMLGIPIYTHEQTIHPGSANRLISNIAQKVFVSFAESQTFFPAHKVVVTGNPVRKSIFETRTSKLIIDKSLPCIYVTGGSLGSHAINTLVGKIIPQLVQKYTVFHQTGNISEFDDFHRFQKLRDTLPNELRSRYILTTHFSDIDIGYVYSAADIVVSRSGANTWFELVFLQKPALFIPLPWAAYNEQRKHAELLASQGAAEIFEQSGNSDDLLELINRMIDNKDAYEAAYQNISKMYQSDAADQIIEHIFAQ